MTALDISNRILKRAGQDPADTTGFYTKSDALAVANMGQRLLALLSLCVERRKAFPLQPGVAWYHALDLFTDWLLPLRVMSRTETLEDVPLWNSSLWDAAMWNEGYAGPGAPTRVRPARIAELEALDSGWQSSAGTPVRYGVLGFDLLFLYKQPAAATTSLLITHAAMPAEIVADGDVPEAPAEYHSALVDYGACWIRLKEGGDRFLAGLADFERFLEAAAKLAAYTRARSLAQRYDAVPNELTKADISRLVRAFKKNPALAKEAREVVNGSIA